ncbi:hypothetical protein HYC85_021611 [Camellia sinensis]|uniref:CN hydrolase domain-containing protein n=1 Tax=Camellia sinensis TaxID=4442 RepID=A0A7J7GLZ7_CAMSI|nr:hypothetical protein HYC85_021611 [Camellia sinensis]
MVLMSHFGFSQYAPIIGAYEIWNSPYSNDSFPVYAEDIDAGGDASPSTTMLSEVASLLKITIVGGSIPERCGDRLYNTCCVFDTDGKLKAKHRKIHLFDIDIPGKISFQESKTLTAGETPTVVDTAFNHALKRHKRGDSAGNLRQRGESGSEPSELPEIIE